MPAVRLEFDVSFAARKPWVPSARLLARWATAVLVAAVKVPAGLKHRPRSLVLSVRVVGLARSRRLNARYRRKDRATNVLSFGGVGAAPDGRYFLGELVICAPVVAREALAQGKNLRSHWAHMTVHGALHLLGFDHERPAEAAEMEARETQILDQLGFSDPYR
ncbi:MAG: rRNA maturation RNase YbeY [Gammaproteobacteria bacterium]